MPAATASPFDATLEIETPEQVMLTYTLAGFGSRALAAILDTAIIIFSSLLLWILFGVIETHIPWAKGVAQAAKQGGKAWAFAIIILLQFVLVWGYYVFFEGVNDGQTPGKRVLKLRVVRDGGFSVTFGASAVRNLSRLVDAQPGLLYAVGAISVLVTRTGKRLGDILAGTFVVHESKSTYTPSPAGTVAATPVASALPVLSDDEYDLLERYVARRNDLAPDRRRALARQVAHHLERHLDPSASTQLAALVMLFERERAARATSVAGRSDTGTRGEQHAIVALGVGRWNEFATKLAEVRKNGLRRMTSSEVSDFVARYRQLTSDLARLQTASRGRTFDTLFFVSRLVAGGHAVLYRQRGQGVNAAIRYLTVDVPCEIRRSAGAIALAVVVFFLPAVISYSVVVRTPATAKSFVAPILIERANRGQAQLHRHTGGVRNGYVTIPEDERPVVASSIITNNVTISYAAFAFGLTAGVGTIFLLVSNGVQLGGGAGVFAAKGVASLLWAFVAPHGVLELSAICLAGGGGLLIASAFVLPGNMTRREALVVRGRRAIRLIAASTLFLAVAGTIEGLISPRVWPIQWKLVVSGATAIAMIAYIALGWRTTSDQSLLERGAVL